MHRFAGRPHRRPENDWDDGFIQSCAWRRFRHWFLGRHPLCVECEREGRLTPATRVDHVTPRRELPRDQWLVEERCQALCASCDSRKTAAGR